MAQIKDGARAPSDRGECRRIRAIRFTDDRGECERRLEAFGLFARTFEQDSDTKFALRVARALRAERRAAHLADDNYDPIRHLVLTRLDRRLKRRRNSPKPGML